MFTSTRAIQTEHQAKGIGPETIRFSLNTHGNPDIVSAIIGMSPPLAGYYEAGVIAEVEGSEKEDIGEKIESTGDEELDDINKQLALVRLYPIFRPYTESPLMQEALEAVYSQSRYRGHPFNKEVALLSGLWDKDSTKLFDPEKAGRRAAVIGGVLIDRFHMDPTQGDALVIMGPKKGWRAFVD